MENSAEVNETLENTVEAPHIKRLNIDEHIISQRTDSTNNALDNAAQTAIPSSPETFMETLAGNDVNYDHGKGSDSGTLVEELTLNNYKGPSFLTEIHEDPSVKTSSWNNFTRFAHAPRGKNAIGINRNTFMSQKIIKKNAESSKQMENCYSKVADHFVDSDKRIALRSMQSRMDGGTQKMSRLSSGFPQFMAKQALKGKGVVSKSQQSQVRSKSGLKAETNTSGKLSETNDDRSLLGGGGGGGNGQTLLEYHHDEVSLRQWLKMNHNRLDKLERLKIFKHMLKIVDASHSQGLILQNVWPSFFLISSSNQVQYVGSSIATSQVEESRCINREIYFSMDGGLKRKSHWVDEDKGLSQQMMHVGGPISTSGCNQFTSDPYKTEEKWYASPEELNGSGHSLASNIYSLGVLFFELFCYFESLEMHSTTMSDLRYRILPPGFLSGSPKEADFCLWLLHPEPSSRPNSRDILMSELLSICEEDQDLVQDQSSSIDVEDLESDLLLHFLLSAKEPKEKHAAKLLGDVECLSSDIGEVEKRYSSKTAHLFDNNLCQAKSGDNSSSNEDRLMRNLDQLENAYFSMRSKVDLSRDDNASSRSDIDVLQNRDRNYHIQNNAHVLRQPSDSLGDFFEGLCKYARYSRFKICGSLSSVDFLYTANVICSLSFDRDEDYFATAGVSKKLKIFDFGALLSDSVDIHYPLIEMSCRSKLSCVCWNSYIKNYLASTDYEGVVQLWDASTGQGFAQYAEHQKRAWSVDFSQVDPTKMASGGDDCTVKFWSINEKKCLNTIRNVANVCCVQFSPHSSHLLAFGSADYKIYAYDLRMTRTPWCTLAGHGKSVSYVKFVDSGTLVSASTDNTLKLWDLNKTSSCGISNNACSLTLTGHTNEKNFIGLSVLDGYIACGSETNEVFAYYRTLPMAITSHRFGYTDPNTGLETSDDNGQFVSSVCWRRKSNMLVAANSSGSMKLLQLV